MIFPDYIKQVTELPDELATSVIYMVTVRDPEEFNRSLPDRFQPPTQTNKAAGLPANVWVGMVYDSMNYNSSIHLLARKLIDVRARIRFLDITRASYSGRAEKEIAELLGSWRCTNCGLRGKWPKPKRCPKDRFLCGDARLESQIQLVYGERDSISTYLKVIASEHGVAVNRIPILRELKFKPYEVQQ